MKKILITVLAIFTLNCLFAQSGELVPNMKNLRTDTIYGKFLHIDGMASKVDTGVVYTQIAPMVFQSTNGDIANTDKEKIMKVEYYIFPGKRKLEQENIVFFIPKTKK